MRFVVFREALPACIHVTVIQPAVDIAIQNTQRNVQHSGDQSFMCPSSLIRAYARHTLLFVMDVLLEVRVSACQHVLSLSNALFHTHICSHDITSVS